MPQTLKFSAWLSVAKMQQPLEKNRVAIFVDGANLFKSANEQGVRLDYLLLRQRLAGNRQVVSTAERDIAPGGAKQWYARRDSN